MGSQINNLKSSFTFSSVLNYLKSFNKNVYLKWRPKKVIIQPNQINKSHDFSCSNDQELKWDIYGNLLDECK
jgi:hypothetical protein